MNPRETTTLAGAASDAELVVACLAGEREAFARIVERYQRLLCSLAYSATGRVAESEDAAQETFITAWSRLGELREPEKLRPWLSSLQAQRLPPAPRPRCPARRRSPRRRRGDRHR